MSMTALCNCQAAPGDSPVLFSLSLPPSVCQGDIIILAPGNGVLLRRRSLVLGKDLDGGRGGTESTL